MRIRVGCEMTYELGQVTPMIAILNVHSSRVSDLERPDYLITTPSVPVEGYRDSFGNWCNRLVAPAGTITLKTETVVRDSGRWDSADPGAEQTQIQNLPAETLLYLLGSRYCETDRLSDVAWSLFGSAPLGWPRVQAICDYVHDHITFGYEHSRATRTAFEAFEEKQGVCRDYAHLALTFCRCLNIPRAIVLATSATSACRRRMRRRTLPPGSRSFWVGGGTHSTPATMIRGSAGS